jgi:arylsulfatase/uncharacterized sulfatase
MVRAIGRGGAGLLSALLLLATVDAIAAGDERPNIVLILADDLGWSDTAPYGGEIDTPNISTLAEEGVLFSNYHTAASCAPTRSMLMSGVDSHRNGLGNMPEAMPTEHQGQPGYEGVLGRNVVTVATMLRDSGYHTTMTGKWHLGSTSESLPSGRGFERTVALMGTGADNWEQKSYAPMYDAAYWFADGIPYTLPDDFYSSKFLVDKTIEFIDEVRGDGRPFFSYVAFQAVHIPVQAPREFTDKYDGHYDQGWTALRKQRRERAVELGLIPPESGMVTMSTTESWEALGPEDRRYQARRMAVYAGMVDAMDHHIGRLVDHLRKTGLYDNTVFLFLSDNGAEPSDPLAFASFRLWASGHYSTDYETLGEKGSFVLIGPSFASAAAAPGAFYKFYSGEGGLRVPLIVSGPGIRSDVGTNAFTHVNDIVPTILELAGVERHRGRYRGREVEPMVGRSLVPVLTGRADRVHPDDEPIGYEVSGHAALFKGDHKLMRNLPPLGDGEWHLYDIVKDPGEARDLRASMPGLSEAMQRDYTAYASANGVLEMPGGYRRNAQMAANLVRARLGWLADLAPLLGAGLLLLLGATAWALIRRLRV